MKHFIPHLQITATHGQIITTRWKLIDMHMQTILLLLQLIAAHCLITGTHWQPIALHKKPIAPLLQLTNTHGGSSWRQPITQSQ